MYIQRSFDLGIFKGVHIYMCMYIYNFWTCPEISFVHWWINQIFKAHSNATVGKAPSFFLLAVLQRSWRPRTCSNQHSHGCNGDHNLFDIPLKQSRTSWYVIKAVTEKIIFPLDFGFNYYYGMGTRENTSICFCSI